MTSYRGGYGSGIRDRKQSRFRVHQAVVFVKSGKIFGRVWEFDPIYIPGATTVAVRTPWGTEHYVDEENLHVASADEIDSLRYFERVARSEGYDYTGRLPRHEVGE